MLLKKEKIAKELATTRHTNTYDGKPYKYHLNQVVSYIKEHKNNDELLCVCWLHDILEDTCDSLQERLTLYTHIASIFGNFVAYCVWCLTDEFGENRKQRKELSRKKLFSNPTATFVKICDRIANIKYSLQNYNKRKLKMYLGEDECFCNDIKNTLENNFKGHLITREDLKKIFWDYQKTVEDIIIK